MNGLSGHSLRWLLSLALVVGLVEEPAAADERSSQGEEPVTTRTGDAAGSAERDASSAALDALVRAEMERAAGDEPATTATLQRIAEDIGGRLANLDNRLTSAESLATEFHQKVEDGTARRLEDVEITDSLQYTLVIKDSPGGAYVSGARKVYPALARRGHHIVRVYNYWPRGDSYAGVVSTIRTRDGLVWELQIHTPQSYQAATEGRTLYERMRSADTSPKERRSLFEELVDFWDVVPVPKGALVQGAVHPRDRLVVRDEFGQIGSAERGAEREAWALRWRNGVWLESVDGEHRFHIGGRMLLDVGVVDQSPGLKNATFTGSASGAKFRQARLLAQGRLFRHLAFKVNYEFAGGDVGFADVFAALMDLGPTDAIRIGHFKVPFSFEQAMSRKYLTFMERSLANALAPDVRETGLSVSGRLLAGRLRWQVGGFRETDGAGDGFGPDTGYDLALRITGLPLRSKGDRRLLHLGFAYVHQFRDGSEVAFSTKPESFLADDLLLTPTFKATHIDMIGAELAMVLGSFSLEAEYLYDFVRRSHQATLQYHGGYVQVGYFLTGESRRYSLAAGTFDRIVPNAQVRLGADGWGAWQLAARFSRVDLDDKDIGGGTEANFTAAINWFPSPITRVSTEYVYGDVWGQGDVHIWQMRFQFEY